jgi:hypothetical protein
MRIVCVSDVRISRPEGKRTSWIPVKFVQPSLADMKSFAAGALLFLLCLVSSGLATVDARAAEIVLERSGVQKLVTQALFKDHGRMTIATGPCAAFLDRPSVTLASGRIQIRSHLLARIGFIVNSDCAGVELSSWIKVSGKPVPVGGLIRLDDIRIDEVDDANTRSLFANSGLANAFPRAVELDVQGALQNALLQSVDQIQTTVESFDFQEVAVVNDQLQIKFTFKVVGR